MEKAEFNELNRGARNRARPCSPTAQRGGGVLRQLDPAITAARPLRIFLYEVAAADGVELTTHLDALHALMRWGLGEHRMDPAPFWLENC